MVLGGGRGGGVSPRQAGGYGSSGESCVLVGMIKNPNELVSFFSLREEGGGGEG